MCVELYRNINSFLNCLNERNCTVRCKKSSHILDTDGISTLSFALLSIVSIVFICKYITNCERHCYLSMSAFLLSCVDSSLKVSDIVESIENSDDIDAVCNRLLYKIFEYIVSIVTVTEHILSSEKHLELGVGHLLTDSAESVPRIFIKETDAGIKCSTAPNLCGIETYLVHF